MAITSGKIALAVPTLLGAGLVRRHRGNYKPAVSKGYDADGSDFRPREGMERVAQGHGKRRRFMSRHGHG